MPISIACLLNSRDRMQVKEPSECDAPFSFQLFLCRRPKLLAEFPKKVTLRLLLSSGLSPRNATRNGFATHQRLDELSSPTRVGLVPFLSHGHALVQADFRNVSIPVSLRAASDQASFFSSPPLQQSRPFPVSIRRFSPLILPVTR